MSVEGEDQGDGVEERKKMASSVDCINNLLPLSQRLTIKRPLECRLESDTECPNSKRRITGEDVAHYLEQLQLVTRDVSHQTLADGLLSLRQSVMAGQSSSSGHLHEDSPSPRKRTLDYEVEEGMECCEDCSDVDDSEAASLGGRTLTADVVQCKRSRLDGVTSPPAVSDVDRTRQLQYNFDSSSSLWHNSREVPVFHNTGDFSLVLNNATSPTLVPPCARTHLSSIPEVATTTKDGSDEVAGAFEVEEEVEEEENGSAEDKVDAVDCGRVWIAPEVQDLCTSQKPLLPQAVLDDMKTYGMELVPYVGPGLLLQQSQSSEEDENASGETLKEDNEEDSSVMDS